MIIVTFTTIPPRFQNIHFTINSILSQTVVPDKIVINVPEKYNNYSNNLQFPKIDDSRIIVNRCRDYGPATKLLGLNATELYDNMTDDDIIIVLDDDRNYNNRMVENFVHYNTIYPDKAMTIAGWEIEVVTDGKVSYPKRKLPRGREFHSCGHIDVLGGCCAFALTKRMCPFNNDEIFKLTKEDPKYYVDDIWLSGFLTLNGTDIYIVPNSTRSDEPRNVNNNINPLCNSNRNKINTICAEYFRVKYNLWK